MPADFYIDVPRRMVFSQGVGVLSLADVTSHMDRLAKHPDFLPEFDQLLDFRQVTQVALTAMEIRQLAVRNIFHPESRRAFVVITDLHHGLVRMFGAYREIAGETGIRIFREMPAALTWLALEEGADACRFAHLQT